MKTESRTQASNLIHSQKIILTTVLALVALTFFLVSPSTALAEDTYEWVGGYTGKDNQPTYLLEGQYFREQTVFAPLTENGRTVDYVDVDRYLGKWYEIATFEQRFQQGCTGTTATYGLNENGTLSVKNECYLGSLDGAYDVINGYARVVDDGTNARLRVYFSPIFGAPYWIIELDGTIGDQPYQWVVVGSVFKSFLWILSRTPQVSDERLNAILDRLEERGYNLNKLSYTVQPEE